MSDRPISYDNTKHLDRKASFLKISQRYNEKEYDEEEGEKEKDGRKTGAEGGGGEADQY